MSIANVNYNRLEGQGRLKMDEKLKSAIDDVVQCLVLENMQRPTLTFRKIKNLAKIWEAVSNPINKTVIPAPPLQGEWRYDNPFLCCGSVKIAHIDIDTSPCPEFIKELLDWVCVRLNEKQV